MITKLQYFGQKSYPASHGLNADKLLMAVNSLLYMSSSRGVYDYWICPNTGSQISGSKGGQGDGGYRTPESTTGAPTSSHKEARGVDVYDPKNDLDDWLTDEMLEMFSLYREAPPSTPGWCHLTDRAPKSGRRTFLP